MPESPDRMLRRLRNLAAGLFLSAVTSLLLWWSLDSLGDAGGGRFFAGICLGSTTGLGLCTVALVWWLIQDRLSDDDDDGNAPEGDRLERTRPGHLQPQRVPVRQERRR